MVYRDGFENRYGLIAIGGSNPSPSARKIYVNDITKFGIGLAVAAVVFGILWRLGYVARLSNYVRETREELRKCTWPSADELKGSTLVVMVTILLLGVYIMGIDLLITLVVSALNSIGNKGV